MRNLIRATLALVLVHMIVGINAPGQSTVVPSLTIQEIDSPSGAGSGEPNLYVSANGRVYLSWIEPAGENRSAFAFRC
jgi:hypothetical protein